MIFAADATADVSADMFSPLAAITADCRR